MGALSRRIAALAAMLACVSGDAAAAPPQMPPVFDRPTVAGLIQNIEQDDNAAKLEFGYFARRSRRALPEAEGLAMVRAALQQTPESSRRWFVLESVLGFGSFRAGASSQIDAYHAYDALFDRAGKASAAHATDVVERAIYELVCTVPGDYALMGGGGLGAGPCVLKAMQTQLALLRGGVKTPYPIPWGLAVRATGGPGMARPLLDAAMKDPSMPHSYDFCVLAAAVLSTSDGARAAALLKQAQALATSSLERQQVREAIVEQLVANKDLMAAIAIQEKWLHSTGTGYADLIRLFWARKDTAGIDAQLTALEQLGANEGEINSTAAVLAALGGKSESGRPLQDRAIALITSYLTAPRQRTLRQELWARLTLADIYIGQKRLADARADIETGLALAPCPPSGQNARAALGRLYRGMQPDVPTARLHSAP